VKREDFSDDENRSMQKVYRLLVKSKLKTSQAVQRIEIVLSGPSVKVLISLMRASKPGFHR